VSNDSSPPTPPQGTMTALEAALRYAETGYRVFPCLPLQKEPAIKAWQNHATTEPKIIRGWFTEFPDRNVAIATGQQPNGVNLLVIDIDVHHGGLDTWRALVAANGDMGMRGSPIMRTPHGGFHIWLDAPKEFRNTRNRLGAGIDTRCAGGYVVVPPSVISLDEQPVSYVSEQDLWDV
jgi:hypothetical protein